MFFTFLLPWTIIGFIIAVMYLYMRNEWSVSFPSHIMDYIFIIIGGPLVISTTIIYLSAQIANGNIKISFSWLTKLFKRKPKDIIVKDKLPF